MITSKGARKEVRAMVSPAYTRASYVSPGIVGPVSTVGLDVNALMETILMFFMVFYLVRAMGKMVKKEAE